MTSKLSEEQQAIVQAALARNNIFITGNAGCGKTVALQAIIERLQKRYPQNFTKKVAVCAPTGIAATHIGGRTYHSALGLGVVRRAQDILSALEKRGVIRLRTLEVLILDEVSMVSAEMFECMSWYLGQARRRPTEPFGGLQVIVCGDFAQIPPIATSAQARAAFPDAFWNRGYAFQAPAWRRCAFKIFHLQKIWRQADPAFANLLNRIKMGDQEAFEDLLTMCGRPLPEDQAILPTELFGTHMEADAVNEKAMADLGGPFYDVEAVDSILAPKLTEAGRAKWMNNDFFRDCPAPATLRLSRGAQVMLVKNLEFEGRRDMLVNGARGVLVDFTSSGDPIVEFRNGRTVCLHAEEFSQEIADGITAVRCQIPLKLAWGLTQMKSQGMTLDCARVSLDRVFAHGQAYVALSRVRDANCLEIRCGARRPSIAPSPEVVAFYQDMEGYDGTAQWNKWMEAHPIEFLYADREPSD